MWTLCRISASRKPRLYYGRLPLRSIQNRLDQPTAQIAQMPDRGWRLRHHLPPCRFPDERRRDDQDSWQGRYVAGDEMKYTEEQYLDAMSGYFGPDEETSNQKVKIVKTRKDHQCMGGDHHDNGEIAIIPAGSVAICETAIHVDM